MQKIMLALMSCLLFAASSAATELNLTGTDNGHTGNLIDGYDYALPTSDDNETESIRNPDGIPLPGVYCQNEPHNMDTLATNDINGIGDGYPSAVMTIDDAHGGSWGEWESYAEKLRNDPHTVILSAQSSDETWGTRAAPQVTYVTEHATISTTNAGTGILIIDAGAQITGNVYFEGLVIYLTKNICALEDNAHLSATNLSVYGAVIVVGEEPLDLEISSNSALKYCSAALANLNKLPAVAGASAGKIASWRQY